MQTIDLRWVVRSFLTILPRLIMVVICLIWVYYSADYFIKWGYRVGSGLKLIDQKPFGGDFSYYWVASQLALAGHPAAVYDPVRLHAALAALFGLDIHLHFFYPPSFLLVVLPFALLPYHASLAVWLLTTFAAYLWVIRRIAPHFLAVAAAVMFAGAIANFGYGQNGFLSTVLLGGGLLLLDGAPLAGGFLLGLLTYKPHLAVLVPVALLAGRRWRALGAMAATAAGLILASGLILGFEVWQVFLAQTVPGFLKSLGSGRVMTAGAFPWAMMPTLFSSIYASGLGFWPAIICRGWPRSLSPSWSGGFGARELPWRWAGRSWFWGLSSSAPTWWFTTSVCWPCLWPGSPGTAISMAGHPENSISSFSAG